MARQIIDIDTVQPNGKKGDPARVMSQKVNGNFEELYGLVVGVSGLGGKNMLINCGIPINQRGFAGGALAAGVYGYDRWKAGAGGCNVTINATTGVFTHTSGPLQQIVESPPLAWGQPLTISVENPSGSIAVSVGGATATITAGSGRRGVTLTPSGSGNMTVQLTATGVTYSRPQLERGSTATPFDARWYALELLLCQRYARKVRADLRFQATAGLQSGNATVPWPEMRGSPSARLVAGGTIGNVSGSPTLQNITAIGARIDAASSAAGDTYCLDRVYLLDAEL